MLYYNCKPGTDGNNILSQVQSVCRTPFIGNDELVSNYADKCTFRHHYLYLLIRERFVVTNIPHFKYSAYLI